MMFGIKGSLPAPGRMALLLCVVAFGLLSVLIGQDANWDLANYHLYNPHALLHGRIGVDLAPAGLQSYFNPLLDLPYYWMAMNLPPRAVAFAMGALHGLNLLLLVAIARQVLPGTGRWPVFLLALAGCLGATFLSELGNTMGDNTTAPLVLASLWLCLRSLPAISRTGRGGLGALAAAGGLMGLAAGLKLTNAIYAVGLCLALMGGVLLAGAGWRKCLGAALAFGLAVLAGLAATSGYWFARMWAEFGNPLFPQFNAFFGSPLAAPISMADTRWHPRSWGEALLFPFVFTRDPARFGETALVQLLWPAAYALFWAWGGVALWRSLRRGLAKAMPQRVQAASHPAASAETSGMARTMTAAARLLLAFVAASYAAWLAVFSIGRYTAAMELLLPLVVWLLLHRLAGAARAPRLARWLIVAALAVGLLRFNTWGTAPFAQQGYTVPPPAISQPERATVLMLAAPAAWMIPFFPQELAFVSLFQFPESAGYRERAARIMQTRGGEVWAIVPVAGDTLGQTVAGFNRWATRHALRADGLACAAVGWGLQRSARYRMLVAQPAADAGGLCLWAVPATHRRDLPAENRAIAQRWAAQLQPLALVLEPASCGLHQAWLGGRAQPYQFCRVLRIAGADGR